jgi:hypothetical protein
MYVLVTDTDADEDDDNEVTLELEGVFATKAEALHAMKTVLDGFEADIEGSPVPFDAGKHSVELEERAIDLSVGMPPDECYEIVVNFGDGDPEVTGYHLLGFVRVH